MPGKKDGFNPPTKEKQLANLCWLTENSMEMLRKIWVSRLPKTPDSLDCPRNSRLSATKTHLWSSNSLLNTNKILTVVVATSSFSTAVCPRKICTENPPTLWCLVSLRTLFFHLPLNHWINNSYLLSGPDICGPSSKKVHVIFNYKGQNHLIKKEIRPKDDVYTHLYTLIVKPDQTYEVSQTLNTTAVWSS